MARRVIVLVEDSQQDELLTIRALQKNNIQNDVIVCRDGAEALDYLFCTGEYAHRDTSIQPQVVLLDLKLPKVDGLEVLRRLRADSRTRRLPVVVLSTSDEERDLNTAYDCGANSYVRKPINFIQFAETIKSLGQYWLLFNQTAVGSKGIG